jgi:hypothetical protein
VLTLPTCDGWTVMWGCEWYHPSTLIGLPSLTDSFSAFTAAADNCKGDISTRSAWLNVWDKNLSKKYVLISIYTEHFFGGWQHFQ